MLDKTSPEATGITPFVLQRPADVENAASGAGSAGSRDAAAQSMIQVREESPITEKRDMITDVVKERGDGHIWVDGDETSLADTVSRNSLSSLYSTDSTTPLRRPEMQASKD